MASTSYRPAPARAASVGVTATLVASNSGAIASGALAFRFEPSELSAETLPATALGETGERMPLSQPTATTAHNTSAVFFISNR